MEENEVPIFESLPLISVVMPYYGYTHQMYLLLSSLSKKTRIMFYNIYKIFRRIMLKYSIEKKTDIKNLSKFLIPFDLFKFHIDEASCINGVSDLVLLTDRLLGKEGWYFNEHCMNEQLCISRIYVDAEYIDKLYSYAGSLESIEIIDNKKDINFGVQKHTLLDNIILESIYSFDDNDTDFKICYFESSDCKVINPKFQPFKRIRDLHFRNEYALRLLKIMNQANILEVEELILDCLNLHTLEEIVNSVHFNYNIKIIRYRSNMCSLLSDKILNNISKIQPQKLELSELSLFPNWIRILSNLPSNITTSFGMLCINDLALKFLDTFVYFKSNEEFTNLHCREINFCYEKINNNDDIMHLEGNNLCLYNFNKMSISNFEIEINSLNLSPKFSNLINSEVNNFIFIPLNNLSEICVSVNILQKLFDRSNSKICFSEIPRTSKCIIKINSIEEIVLFDKISSFVPKNSELEINAVIYLLDREDSIERVILLKIVSIFRLKLLDCIHKSEIESIKYILSCFLIQKHLQYLKCSNLFLSECLVILSLCNECKMLETIYITHKKQFSEYEANQISEAKRKVINSCINIRSIIIERE